MSTVAEISASCGGRMK